MKQVVAGTPGHHRVRHKPSRLATRVIALAARSMSANRQAIVTTVRTTPYSAIVWPSSRPQNLRIRFMPSLSAQAGARAIPSYW